MSLQGRPSDRIVEAVDVPEIPARHVVFLLHEGFTYLAFACALEPLRLASLAAGRTLYR